MCSNVALAVSTPADADPLGSRGAILACPPFCAGDLERMRASSADALVVPFPTDSGEASFSPTIQSSVASARVVRFDSATYLLSPGVRYVPSCAAAGFTDSASGACSNFSDPASLHCALGSGDACSPCPSDALCPGGASKWPRPGYYSLSETDATIQVCSCGRVCGRSPCYLLFLNDSCRPARLPTRSPAVRAGITKRAS